MALLSHFHFKVIEYCKLMIVMYRGIETTESVFFKTTHYMSSLIFISIVVLWFRSDCEKIAMYL